MDDDALRAWSVSVRYPGQPEPALADVSPTAPAPR